MKADELRQLISDTLCPLGLWTADAENLLLGTCAQESRLGHYRRQMGGGPALGIFQMEPATFRDTCDNYLRWKPELAAKIKEAAGIDFFDPADLEENDRLAVCFARVHYLRVKEAIPYDLEGWARYWKKYYNTPLGKGKEPEFVENYKRLVV